MANIVNVLLHGIFGYVLGVDYIDAYTPCVCGHIYETSTGPIDRRGTPFPRGDYALKGVRAGNGFPLDKKQFPQVPIVLEGGPPLDEFSKRHSMFRLPYPQSITDIHALDAFQVGSIYAGRDSAPMNGAGLYHVGRIASLHAFTYEMDAATPLQLSPLGPIAPTSDILKPIPIASAGALVDQAGITNFHIWCTTPSGDMSMHGYTPEGHLRRGFAALIDMFPRIEITIDLPDGFAPEAIKDKHVPGITDCDVDPGRRKCRHPEFGHVNCHYANVLFAPTTRAAEK